MGPEYIGGVHPNCDYFHGQIPYAKGVHLYQVSRASRDPETDDGTGHTYKHAPDLCWYEGRYYIQYLTNPKDEHGGAGVSVLASSADGRSWGDYRISFPEYRIPACETTDYKGLHHVFDGTKPAFMHQRMAFYRAKNGVMLLLGFYGWSPELWMTNWDNYGIGRVVRRLYPDGSLGEIFFIRVNWQAGWKKEQLLYPMYEEKSGDVQFQAACRELLQNPLAVQQWAEENGDRDPMIRIKHPDGGTYQAFCWYHRTEQDVVGLWKHSFVSESHDGGESWETPVKSPSLVMSGQKIWGERTSDGRYALVYDPTPETQHRFPMCVVTSDDGLHFDDMRLIHGEVPPIRYEGFCKDLGPQYMRGISEGNPRPDGDLCVAYSVNKEDIWFARIPVPVTGEDGCGEIREDFYDDGVLREWNLYQPFWCRIDCLPAGELLVEDREPYDYARLVRFFPTAGHVSVVIRLRILVLEDGKSLQVELCGADHKAAVRILFRRGGRIRHRTVCELDLGHGGWKAGEEISVAVDADCAAFSYTVVIDGAPVSDGAGAPVRFPFMAAVNGLAELSLRTGEPRYLADVEHNPDGLPKEPLEAQRLSEGARYELLGIRVVMLN